ncbi:ATP-dependent DNA helicase PIF4-like [Pistacia vera]|uniref:ATP-dependent DNA helicase PIF4-like n=1 Tax=Pistacia vera TaxID=55513 RepID=UPI0012632073|nr:ATP-dependent DNA helicase PIF4-like [Pistacia vera]
MPISDHSAFENAQNKLILEELNYDNYNNKTLHNDLYKGLNNCQRHIYNSILDLVNNQRGIPFFVYGHVRIGKTFLWSAIIAKLRSERKIVLTIATSGIAALVQPGGRTSHSRFKIPLDTIGQSTCDIKKGTQLTKLLLETSLIIWDEAPVENIYCFEVLDRTFRDILSEKDQSNADIIYGGVTVAPGGDFRQILPIIPKRKKHDIMQAYLSSSSLWQHVTVLKLTENMRLKKNLGNPTELNELNAFDKWLLEIREGTGVVEDESYIQIPEDLKVTQHNSPQETIVNVVFPD